MSYDLYWRGDVWAASDYRRAQQLVNQRRSEEMWLQGLYNFTALSLALGNAFRKKGTSAKRYPEEPFRVIPYSPEELEARAEAERQKAVAYFNALQKKWDRAKCRVPSAERRAPLA